MEKLFDAIEVLNFQNTELKEEIQKNQKDNNTIKGKLEKHLKRNYFFHVSILINSIRKKSNLDLFKIDNNELVRILPNLNLSDGDKESFRENVKKIINKRNRITHYGEINLEEIIDDLDELIKINEINEKTKTILLQLFYHYNKQN
jgi:hypothetical protein